ELIFPLVEKTREPMFEDVDLLDFPGYRGRLSVESLDDVRRAVKSDDANPVAQLILRGKVAYLFERYTDSQEMNVLIVCTPSNKQSDVTSVGPVLTEWIARTQGSTPEVRARRKSGLLWAITMFDMRIGNSLDHAEDILQIAWGSGGMMKMAMLERFGQYAWMQEWVPGQPFNNTFLVRKPRMKVAFIDIENGEEKAVNATMAPQLNLMRRTFSEDETVREHVREPANAWDSMMALNDGGMGGVTGYLQQVALRSVKLERIREQLDDLVHDLVENRLGPWFLAEGAGEMEKKKKIAQQIVDALKPRAVLLGDFLQRLQLPDDLLRTLYLRVDDEPIAASAPSATGTPAETAGALNLGGDLISLGDDLDLFASDSAPKASTKSAPSLNLGSDARYAQAVLREWISHLRNIPEDQRLMAFFGFPKAAVESLVDELITAANRVNLQTKLLDAIAVTEQVSTKREQLVDRQVLAARTVLADFIAWLGFIDQPVAERPDSAANKGAKLFESPTPIPLGQLPDLPPQPINHT
ncbi:MAG TPA: virulence factor SrfC family protein, partial [Dongiaceae bacterium]|nr:virulence factor SrfC family protein [Dongiaceae bacterium]